MSFTLLDELMPTYHAFERHGTVVAAPRQRAWAALRAIDFGGSPIAVALLALRALPSWRRRRSRGSDPRRGGRSGLTLDGLLDAGFVLLAERPEEEVVLGLVGKFWRPSGGIRRIDPAEFTAFDEPGWAKAAWSFRLVEGVPPGDGMGGAGGFDRIVVTTETRVYCTDAASRRAFLRYWRLVRPFSGLIRREALRLVRRAAEQRSGP